MPYSNGLSRLKDACTFAALDIGMYWRFQTKTKDFDKAVAFAKSIPVFEDLNSDDACGWMLHDEEHLKYM